MAVSIAADVEPATTPAFNSEAAKIAVIADVNFTDGVLHHADMLLRPGTDTSVDMSLLQRNIAR